MQELYTKEEFNEVIKIGIEWDLWTLEDDNKIRINWNEKSKKVLTALIETFMKFHDIKAKTKGDIEKYLQKQFQTQDVNKLFPHLWVLAHQIMDWENKNQFLKDSH